MRKRLFTIVAAAILVIATSGCWDHVEINAMRIVAGVGLDISETPGFYLATVEIINIESGQGDDVMAEILQGEGPTIYTAIQAAMTSVGGKMFANHCKVVIIGEGLATEGINSIIDIVLRNIGFRKSVDIIVAKGAQAADIFTGVEQESGALSYTIGKVLHNNAESQSNTSPIGVYKLHESIISRVPVSVIPTAFIVEEEEPKVSVEGGAIFYEDRLAGFIDGDEFRLYSMITDSVKGGYLLTFDPEISSNLIGVRIERTKANITPHIQGSRLIAQVQVEAQAVLEGPMLVDIDIEDRQSQDLLRQSLEKQLSNDLYRFASGIQEDYGLDIFGFHREFEDRFRQEWGDLSKDWGAHFSEIEMFIESSVNITGSGLMGNFESGVRS